MTVRDKAEHLATFRWLAVFCMETLARWVPTTPEMEVKVLFGRHIWDLAQHADVLGARTFELRAPLHYTLTPVDAHRGFMEDVSHLETTAERVLVFYEVVIPGLASRYRSYVEQTDPLLDEPSVRILRNVLMEGARMREEAETLRSELSQIQWHSVSTEDWASREMETAQIVAPVSAVRRQQA